MTNPPSFRLELSNPTPRHSHGPGRPTSIAARLPPKEVWPQTLFAASAFAIRRAGSDTTDDSPISL